MSCFYNVCEMKDTTIDLVISYVNNKDTVWRENYISYCKKCNFNQKIVELLGSRYGGLTFIYDNLKLVTKNMPWINKIYLLISNIEQIDKTRLPSNCEIVLHEQFIPHRFLPTFNSTTIEMFLWNIPNLSENFIYANDDMLPTGKLEPKDFFESGKIKIDWRINKFDTFMNVYSYQCHNVSFNIARLLNKQFDSNLMIRPVHSFTPIIKSHAIESYNLLKKLIEPHIRAFRTQYQFNQYIYPVYEYFKYGTLDSGIDFLYTELKEDFDLNHQIVCINCEKNSELVKKYKEEIRKLCN